MLQEGPEDINMEVTRISQHNSWI